MNDTRAEKSELRKKFLGLRRALSKTDREDYSAKITETILTLTEISGANRIFCYASMDDEVSTESLIKKFLMAKKSISLPFITGRAKMEAAIISDYSELAPGKFGILTVKSDAERIAPEDLDAAIIPGVAFSRSGVRLGMGGGYYDAFLPLTKNMIRIAAAFSCQISDELPAGSYDSGVHIIVTENEIIRI